MSDATKIERGDDLAQGRDLAAENRRKLAGLFPGLLTEGADGPAIDADALRDLVGATVDNDTREKFGLGWHGKAAARRLALTPSAGTLRPAPGESVNWDTTQNAVIEGDNLEVLKLLQKAYAGRVKLIYIDPPYNTGKDFVYKDNFRDPIGHYQKLTGQTGENGEKLTSNPEGGGRFHTDWLNMIYPRLLLARELLTQSGFLFVSIDDNELSNVRHLCDEVFGSECFVGRVTWERKRKGSHLSKKFVQKTESLVVYTRAVSDDVQLFGEAAGAEEDQPLIKRTNSQKELSVPGGAVSTSLPDQDLSPGRYGEGSSSVELLTPGIIRDGTFTGVIRLRGPFVWSQENLDEELAEGAKLFIRTLNLSLRALKAPHRQGFKALSSFLSRKVGTNEDALTELAELLEVEEDAVPIDYPKPVSLLKKVVTAATFWDSDAVVLDFFAGSGTTGHATMEQNAADGGNRRYVLVQLPEKTGREDYPTIADLTKERLRRAGARIKEEGRRMKDEEQGTLIPTDAGAGDPATPQARSLDTGFRVFKLDTANVKAWDAPTTDQLEPGEAERLIKENIEAVKPDRSDADLLWGALLNLGLPLDGDVDRRQVDGRAVHVAGAGTLLACFAGSIDRPGGERLAEGMAGIVKELGVEGEVTALFRDGAFAGDDAAKVNLVENLRQRLPKGVTARVRSI